MSSHPMLQPTDWERAPDELVGSMPQARVNLYRLIWNSALACTLKAPTFKHVRSVFRAGHGVDIAFAGMAPTPDRLGYWRFRTDMPAANFPHQVEVPRAGSLRVLDAWIQPPSGTSLGSVISEMEHRGIGTPATVASMLKNTLDVSDGSDDRDSQALLELSDDGEQPRRVRVTEHGKAQLQSWRSCGLLGRNALTNNVVDEVGLGKSTCRDGLMKILGPGEFLEKATDYIHQACDRR